MSKKDYELIAQVLRDTRTGKTQLGNGPLADAYWQDRADIVAAFATELASTNPRFDRKRFIAACMGEDSTDSAGRAVRYSTFGPNDVAR